MTDTLEQLFAFRWRDVEIPISRMRMSIAHDVVEHKYWGVDGARIESTGLAPTRVSATIPLQNGMVPGYREGWDPGKIYPTLLRSLLVSFSKREKGKLQHPEVGGMICKAEKLEIDWDAMKRGGCDAEASWVETADDDASLVRADKSPVADMEGAARDFDSFDSRIADLVDRELEAQGFPGRYPVFEESFESMMNKAAGMIDKVSFAIGAPQRFVDRMVYRAEQIENAVDRSRTALGWPVRHSTQSMVAAANGLRRELVEANRAIGTYRVLANTTLAALRVTLNNNTMTDLIRLNPKHMASPEILAGAIVRFYGIGTAGRYYGSRSAAQPRIGR
jgi:hypothetical protein